MIILSVPDGLFLIDSIAVRSLICLAVIFQFLLGFCCMFMGVIEGSVNTYLMAVYLIYGEVYYMTQVRNRRPSVYF